MKYFFDTEFMEDGKTIDLISIAVVAEDGREFVAINEEADWHRIVNHEWLRENVLPNLPVIVTQISDRHWRLDPSDDLMSRYLWRLRDEIRKGIVRFIGDDPEPEFWAYYADYDWVAFCQLFGRMIDLPSHFPKYCRDLKQLIGDCGIDPPRQVANQHNALADARWVKDAYEYVTFQRRYMYE